MTTYNKYKTAYRGPLGGWFLLPRAERAWKKLLGCHTHGAYLGDHDEEVEDITPELREILLDAEDDGSFTRVWMEFQKPYNDDRYWIAQNHIARMRNL